MDFFLWLKKHLLFVGLVLFLTIWTVFLWVIHPDTLVAAIGIQNTYGVAFLLAALGGLSTVTGASFFATIVAFILLSGLAIG